MSEQPSELQEESYAEWRSWNQLFRVFWIALDPKKLVLGGLGVFLAALGSYLIGYLFDRDSSFCVFPSSTQIPVSQSVFQHLSEGDMHGLSEDWMAHLKVIVSPARELLAPFSQLFSNQPQYAWSSWSRFGSLVHTVTTVIWMVLVWGFLGGAITRIAAVQIARDEKIGLVDAILFARNKCVSYVAAPVFPLIIVMALLMGCMLGGWVVRIPWIGTVLGGALWGLPLIAGFVMTIILLGLSMGWPLMLPAISAEGSDSFDALSRSYSYVFQKPWKFIFYTSVAIIYGALVFTFIVGFGGMTVHLSGWAVSAGATRSKTAVFYQSAPEASGWRETGRTLLQESFRDSGEVLEDDTPNDDTIESAGKEDVGDTDPLNLDKEKSDTASETIKDSAVSEPVEEESQSKLGGSEDPSRVLQSPVSDSDPSDGLVKVSDEMMKEDTTSSEEGVGKTVESDANETPSATEAVSVSSQPLDERLGGALSAIWLYLAFFLLLGFVYSYFWSASTMMYFLLRKDVDATDYDEVFLEEDEDDYFSVPPFDTDVSEPVIVSQEENEDNSGAGLSASDSDNPVPDSTSQGSSSSDS